MRMLSKSFLYLFCSVVLLSCINNKEGKRQPQSINQDSLPVKDMSVRNAKQEEKNVSKGDYIKVTQKTAIKVLSANKMLDTASDFLELYKNKCDKWYLSKKDVHTIFVSSKEIDGQEFHHYYDVLPCYYSGKISIDGKIASYEVNAGAFLTLFFKDTSVYFGYKMEDYKKYFLIGPGTE